MDLISIIVPVYKVEKYLDKCVESIVNQTYKNLEIILVDDGSPDNCPKMCDDWAKKDKRIIVIHKENGGLSDARNAGMKIASGEYIAFVDSDDWIDNEYIQSMYEVAKKYDSKFVACNIRLTDELGNSLKDEKNTGNVYQWSAHDTFKDHWEKFRATAWNKLYKKNLLDNECFKVGKFHEDEFFTYKIVDKAENVAYIDKTLYNYRQRSQSIMTTFSIKHLDALEAYYDRIVLMKEKYPDLYVKDKSVFCWTCVNFYIQFMQDNVLEAMSQIKTMRKKLKFSLKEIFSCKFKDAIYIIGTGLNINLFCRLLFKIRK